MTKYLPTINTPMFVMCRLLSQIHVYKLYKAELHSFRANAAFHPSYIRNGSEIKIVDSWKHFGDVTVINILPSEFTLFSDIF